MRSEATYLLTTIYTDRSDNKDIVTGQWRPLNLLAAPFELPEPLECINEGSTERNGIYADKSLLLWRIADLRDRLRDRPAR